MKPVSFQIYNASAGSGKTYNLVKNYLSILLSTNHLDSFKQVLAITFTNKAVNEMKERVLKNLNEFSKNDIIVKPTPLFLQLQAELQITPEELHNRASKILNRILYNYAFFDILTIDKFNHRLIRTFAFDLKLSTNFEVSLDEKALLAEAVDNLIYRAGSDKTLTDILIDFALSKADQDKSWDISRDLREIAELLSKEDHSYYIKLVEEKPLQFFSNLGRQLIEQINTLEMQAVQSAQNLLDLFSDKGLEFTDFQGSYLPKRLLQISLKNFNHDWNSGWFKKMDSQPLYPKRIEQKSPNTAVLLDELQQHIYGIFLEIKDSITEYYYLKNFHKNLTPLSLLNAINAELNKIKEERNILLISEFNRLISTTIVDQPAPFIYERIGEKYKHYFIDEFQDTSILQWENLKPLVSNALESELPSGKTGSILIVGDAKQAIYRWRGGKAEQFIDLYNDEIQSPFQSPKTVENLPKNYRSYDEIIKFNNGFFNFISQHLNNSTYRELFEKFSSQLPNDKHGGHISFSFIDHQENKEAEDDLYQVKTFEIIKQVISNGFDYGDICIITRSNSNGLLLADYLTQQDIQIISSESLLLKNNRKVSFLIQLIRHLIHENDPEINYQILIYLAEKQHEKNVHPFIENHLLDLNTVFDNYHFKSETFLELPLYNAIEYAIIQFQLAEGSDAYLQFFLDEVLDFTQNNNGSLSNFLSYWEQNRDRLSIAAPEDSNAVRIMTIHKSKGLEFPVVIFPYANTDTQRNKSYKKWLPVDTDTYGIPFALFDSEKVIEAYSEEGAKVISEDKEILMLDNYNLLYVTLTRAVEQLYIIGKRDLNAKGEANTRSFAGLFISYLKNLGQWSDSLSTFGIGNPNRVRTAEKNEEKKKAESIPFNNRVSWNDTVKMVTRGGSLWGTEQQKAIDRGNLYHYLLSKIIDRSEVEATVTAALNNGLLSENENESVINYLQELVHNPKLTNFFTEAYKVYTERDLYADNGTILRPDRFMIQGNTAHIIDYKTGAYSDTHQTQINHYADALGQIGYEVESKLIVYINDEINIVEA